jgi:hypothetical protein
MVFFPLLYNISPISGTAFFVFCTETVKDDEISTDVANIEEAGLAKYYFYGNATVFT